ncbi:CRISPR-associated endonuclease Cas1 [Desulfurobacterium atlanticum]|uniref:CRISPR-associated endonuclease Cas1 n=1 Tax=Desulfurobacterium atlanticum TaxID=240169 RepID=A0A238Y452_9BACT|nr:CRISPR-associated endonuclease Cas1 [Desulfurobacterium atlanticum]SNR65897.1 CRISPR-associated endonuclease Cas1 [Desulfurobacterium atlanticum]
MGIENLRNIFITTHGAVIRKRKYELIVEVKNRKYSIPFGTFSNVFIVANVNLTTPVIKSLSGSGKYIFIVRTNGELSSIILPQFLRSSSKRRINQYKSFEIEYKKVAMIQELLRRKALLAQWILEKFYDYSGRHYLEKSVIKSFYKDTAKWIEKSDKISLLRSIDGFIMNSLYRHFSAAISGKWKFEKRTYNPPENEVNSLLSLVYTYTYSILIPLIVSFDLDPYCGFFHEKRGKHAALASDILEILRPGLIFFVADMLNSEFLTKSDFRKTKRSVLIKPEALKVISKLYSEKILNSDFFFPVSLFIHEVVLKYL